MIGTDDSDTFIALTDWLRRDAELVGVTIEPVTAEPAPEDLGLGSDAVRLVGDNKDVLAVVATTLGIWLSTRIRRTKICVEVGDRKVVIDTGHVKDPDKIACRILEELQRPDGKPTAKG